jgi:hypothetical protein
VNGLFSHRSVAGFKSRVILAVSALAREALKKLRTTASNVTEMIQLTVPNPGGTLRVILIPYSGPRKNLGNVEG